MVGIVPVLIGFAFLGLSLFWDSARFKSFGTALFTCFAAMNGDSLLDIFYDMTSFRFLLGMAYLMIFTFCGIAIVQNIFFIMIEHGFLGIKYARSYQWLHEKYKDQIQTQYSMLQQEKTEKD